MVPLLFVTYYYLSFNIWWLALAVLSPLLALCLLIADNFVFWLKLGFERREMRKMLHRYRYKYLKRGQVIPPGIDNREEDSYDV